MAIQTAYSHIAALVVDDLAAQQTTLRSQLQMLGIGQVDVAASAEEALRQVRKRAYGLIVCDYNLNHKSDGQQLFEYLRDAALLPPDCLFFMVTAEAGYAAVASASEHRPDAYLVKPITAGDVEDRLKSLLARRNALLMVTEKIADGDLAAAVDTCDRLLVYRDRWSLHLQQLKAESLLDLGRHEDAQAAYQRVLAEHPHLVWAQLGLARACKAGGSYDRARQIARAIVASPEGDKNLGAYDVIAETMEAEGDTAGALATLKDAAARVPSARRQRLVGESAYRNGDMDTAQRCLQAVTKATRGSLSAQPRDTLLLAQTLIDQGDASGALALLKQAGPQVVDPKEHGAALQALQAQAHARAGDVSAARAAADAAAAEPRNGKTDFASLALAKARLLVGDTEDGFRLLSSAISADHENPRVRQLVSKALRDTGHEADIERIVEASAAAMKTRVGDARALLRESRIDEAVSAIEATLTDYPDNTGVLLQAAQINCMAFRLRKRADAAGSARIDEYLVRLDSLMPGSDRVLQMKRYFRDTVAALTAPLERVAA